LKKKRVCNEGNDEIGEEKKVSLLKQKEIIEDPLLKKNSEVLKIPVETFQNFDEEQAVNIISNMSTASDNATGFMYNHHPTFIQ
jgi:hypothetical protein